jgi:resolvase-like protein
MSRRAKRRGSSKAVVAVSGDRALVDQRRAAADAASRILIGYAHCSTDKQDLAAQRHALFELGVSEDRVYLDHGMTGRDRKRPGLEQALAAVREGDTLVVPKLDRLARSVPDARAIGYSLAARGVRLSLGRLCPPRWRTSRTYTSPSCARNASA